MFLDRTLWFSSNETDRDLEYELVGTIIGLAIYNQVVLDAHLPTVVYKKLLPDFRENLSFQDFKETFPDLANGLEKLLEFEGDVENTFCLTFSVCRRHLRILILSRCQVALRFTGCSDDNDDDARPPWRTKTGDRGMGGHSD